MAKTIIVQYLNDTIEKLQKSDKGDWIDLRAAHDYSIKKGDFVQSKIGRASCRERV